jgi:pyruvate dehydrogenase E2 component (dihydrolipoamide acetyltransferase)
VVAEFVMPSLGADMTDGTLAKWRVTVGDRVAQGDIIAEVETDKGTIEVEVFASGVIEALLVEEGEKVPVGTPLAEIGEAASAPVSATAPVPASAPVPESAPASAPTPAPTGDRVQISPYARRLAQQRRIDLGRVRGTGLGGAIQARDLEGEPPTPSADSPKERMQRAIATAMTRANDEIPHYYVEHTIDMGPALEWIRAKNASLSVNERLVSGVLFLRAVARALRKHPQFNATWQAGKVVQSDGVHVGFAVSLRGGGLVAPALRDTDQGSLSELMARLTDLVARARAGTLRSSEMTSATITLTSLGERGVESVTPIIFPPQVAIVGFGAILTRPWVVDDQIVARPVVRVTLGADHRVSSGHQGARFLSAVDRLLQEPEKL